MEDNELQIKSYVWAGDKCFLVSTIERDSSAMEGPRRYNETIVWGYDWEKAEMGKMLYQESDTRRSITTHQNICRLLFNGSPLKDD